MITKGHVKPLNSVIEFFLSRFQGLVKARDKYASPFLQNTEEIGQNRLLLGGFILVIDQYKIPKGKNKHIVKQKNMKR
jgi:hypothetical protein